MQAREFDDMEFRMLQVLSFGVAGTAIVLIVAIYEMLFAS
jgi:hypothetical protein